jgi:energy-coupling factor transport system substrate-specific component
VNRVLRILEPTALFACPFLLAALTVARVGSAALLSALVLLVALAPAIVGFERARPRPRDFMPVVVLAALAIAGRLLFDAIPNFQPTTALIIVCGFVFGRRAGLMAGITAALVSNLFLGQGLWTPWQMYCWGTVGYCAGLFPPTLQVRHAGLDPAPQTSEPGRRSDSGPKVGMAIPMYLYGVVASLAFGVLMDLQYFVGFNADTGLSGLATTLALGLPFNVAHAASTLVFLVLTLNPWGKKLTRLKTKYGLQDL